MIVQNANEAMYTMVRDIMTYGEEVAPRGMKTRELTSYTLRIRDPRDRLCDIRPIRKGYAAAKVAWDLAEREDVESLLPWNPNGKRFTDDGIRVQGENYGQRISRYVDEMLELLRIDPDSRRVWVPVWQGKDLVTTDDPPFYPSRTSSNVPCTIGFGIRIINGKLVMQTVMRSNSVIGVFPYDVFWFTTMQELIANELGYDLGHYEHTMLSAHVYEREAEQAESIMTNTDWSEHRPMRPIGFTLTQARNEYPAAFEELTTRGNLLVGTRGAGIVDDPIIHLMIEGAKEVERV